MASASDIFQSLIGKNKNMDPMSLLGYLVRNGKITKQEAEVLVANSKEYFPEVNGDSFYLPTVDEEFYIPKCMRRLTDPRNLRRL